MRTRRLLDSTRFLVDGYIWLAQCAARSRIASGLEPAKDSAITHDGNREAADLLEKKTRHYVAEILGRFGRK
jgi:hypothetical protein